MRYLIGLLILFSLILSAQVMQQGVVAIPGSSGSAPFTPLYTTNNASSTTTGTLNTTGAMLIVIQCNSFGAACHTGTGFGETTANTYTGIGDHSSGSFHVQFFYKISPATGTAETWTATSSDTLYVSVYGAPTSGGTSWAVDSSATGYNSAVANTNQKAALSITPTVAHDVIVAGVSDNIAATAKACSIVTPGGTNAAPIVFTLNTCNTSSYFLVSQPVTVTGVSPSAFNGSYLITSLASASTLAMNNASPPGSSWSSGGTLTTDNIRYLGSTAGGCVVVKTAEYNTSNAKETGASGGTSDCNSTSQQDMTWIQYSANFLAAVVAFKPV